MKTSRGPPRGFVSFHAKSLRQVKQAWVRLAWTWHEAERLEHVTRVMQTLLGGSGAIREHDQKPPLAIGLMIRILAPMADGTCSSSSLQLCSLHS